MFYLIVDSYFTFLEVLYNKVHFQVLSQTVKEIGLPDLMHVTVYLIL